MARSPCVSGKGLCFVDCSALLGSSPVNKAIGNYRLLFDARCPALGACVKQECKHPCSNELFRLVHDEIELKNNGKVSAPENPEQLIDRGRCFGAPPNHPRTRKQSAPGKPGQHI